MPKPTSRKMPTPKHKKLAILTACAVCFIAGFSLGWLWTDATAPRRSETLPDMAADAPAPVQATDLASSTNDTPTATAALDNVRNSDSGAPVDMAFAHNMLPLLEQASLMASEVINRGDDEDLRGMAQTALPDLQHEADLLRSWIEQRAAGSEPAAIAVP